MQRQKLGVGASSLSSSSIFSSPSEPALDRKMAVYVLARLSPYLSVCLGFLGFLGSLLLCSFVPNELHSKSSAEYRSWRKSMALMSMLRCRRNG